MSSKRQQLFIKHVNGKNVTFYRRGDVLGWEYKDEYNKTYESETEVALTSENSWLMAGILLMQQVYEATK